MNEREELKQELEQELQWIQYRENILGIIEEKLLLMKQIAEQAKEDNISPEELEVLNKKMNRLAEQVRALDSESRKMDDKKILE